MKTAYERRQLQGLYREHSRILALMPIPAWLVFGFLFLAIPLILIYGMKSIELVAIGILPLLIVGYSSMRLAFITFVGSPRFLSVTFWVFVYSFFGVVPLLQFLSGDYSLRGSYRPYQLFLAMGIVITGIVAFEIGQGTAWQQKITDHGKGFVQKATRREIIFGRLILLFGFGVCTLGLAMVIIGPMEYLFSSRAEVFEYFAALPGPGQVTLNLASSAVRVPILVVSLVFLALLINKNQKLEFVPKSYRYLYPFRGIVAWGAVLVGFLANNPVNSPRYLVGSIFLAVLFIFARAHWRRRYMSWLILWFVMSLLVFFPMLDVFRYSTTDTLIYSFDLGGVTRNLTTKGDFDAFQQLVNVVIYVDANGWALGRQFLGALLFFAPRVVWPDKPSSTGVTVGEWMSYDFTNLSCPLWGEFYFDMGIGGVFFGFLIYGWIVGTLERTHAQARPASLRAFGNVALGILAAYQIFLLRGSLLPAIAYLSPILFGLWIVSRRMRNGGSARAIY